MKHIEQEFKWGIKMWVTKKIGDICSIKRGASPRPIQQFLDKEGIPWVKIADATSSYSRYIETTNQFIKPEGADKSVTVSPGTLILSNSATPGLPKIMKIKACVHDGWLILSDFRDVTRDFLYYMLLNIRKTIINQANGSVFQNLKTDIVRNFDILLPPIEYQQKLVKFLVDIDEKIYVYRQINTNLLLLFLLLFILVQLFFRQINTNLERQAQAIFKEMFIQKKGKPILLSDFCDFIKGKNPAVITSTYQTGAAFYLNIDSLTDIKQTYAIPKNFAMANVKDILMVMDGASSGTVYFGKEGIIGSTLAKIVVSDLSMQEVIYQALKYFENDVRSHTTGSAIPHVDKQYILQLSVSLPDDYQLYSAYFETIRNMMIENRTKNICLTALRDTLLPKLMSGEIDVSKIELD